MATCDVCGNDYDKAFRIEGPSGSGTFDSLECAAHALAPTCAHCGVRILGHGLEADGTVYCCAHCARESGQGGLSDRAEGGADSGDAGIAPTRPPSES